MCEDAHQGIRKIKIGQVNPTISTLLAIPKTPEVSLEDLVTMEKQFRMYIQQDLQIQPICICAVTIEIAKINSVEIISYFLETLR
jgi:hypothetical protein